MDNGWAVVLGAAIALIGSALIPWVREAMQASRTEKARVDRAIETGIREVVHSLMTIANSRPMSITEIGKLEIEAQDTVTSFELLLRADDHPLTSTLDLAFTDAASKDERLRILAKAAMPIYLTGWRNGVYSPREVKEKYSQRRTEALGEPELSAG